MNMTKRTIVLACGLLIQCLVGATALGAGQEQAAEILEAAGLRGGLIVHLGCGDGRLTVELRASESYLVQGLDKDPANVDRARERIAASGTYGFVTADVFDGSRLPYIDNLVSLLVAEDLGEVSMDEVMRALRPGGVALVRRAGVWSKSVKPRPEQIDEWTHFLHGPNNNAVARDTVVDSPRRLQWDGGPKWTRSHEKMSSMTAMVSAGERVFYIMDEGPSSSVQLPPKWQLVARDAFNGVVLWRRDLLSWQTHLWPLKAGPVTVPRRLVATGDRVYVTLGLAEPVTALDAATGLTVKTYTGTEGTEEILVSEGVLFLRVNEDFQPDVFNPKDQNCWTESKRAKSVIGIWTPSERQHIAAVDAESGKERWSFKSPAARLTLTVDADSVFFHTGREIVALDRETGDVRWRQGDTSKFDSLTSITPPTMVSYGDVLFFHHASKIRAYSRETGDLLWMSSHPRSGHMSPTDVLIVDNLVWSGGMGQRDFIGKDLHTGEEKRRFSPPEMIWFHPRCHRSKATTRFLLTSRTGLEVADVRNKQVDVNHWTRGACVYGIMPANGLIYAGPHSCACLMETKTSGFNAFAPAKQEPAAKREPANEERLTKGPAYADAGYEEIEAASAWPMYRRDPMRSGSSPTKVSTEPQKLWSAEVGGKLTSLVSAYGMVVAVASERNTIHALDARTGKQIWEFTCGGRVDSPPSFYKGRVYFGSRDGYVYCLRARDGKLVWRFLAAPSAERLVSYGQVESVWPVHGSVLTMNDAVFFIAGRSAFLDGGLRFYKLDAKSGNLLAMSRIDEKAPDTGEHLQKLQDGWLGLTMPVANPDILTSDGGRLYMGSQPFDMDGGRPRIAPDLDVESQDRPDAHLFSPVGLLDDNWHHRSYWMYGVTGEYGWHTWFEGAKYAPSGRILSFDDNAIYGFARKPEFLAQSPAIEYQLYKADKRPAPDGPARVAKTAKEHTEHEWNQTQWLSLGELYKPEQLTALKYHWLKPDPPIQVRAMVLAENALFIAGPPDVVDEVELWRNSGDPALKAKLPEQAKAWSGSSGGSLWAVSLTDGSRLASLNLESPPVFDGMIAADNKILLSLMNGEVVCYGSERGE
jgi:outer membrane protein assembly factor BamB